jgi:hypothetical protein
MKPADRVVITILGVIAVIVLCPVLLVGAALAYGGVTSVHIQDRSEGFRLYLPLPSVLVEAGVLTVTLVVPERELLEVRAEIGNWGPLLEEVARTLEECPDVILVEVEDGDERVRVVKRGRSLRVEVDEPDLHVRVSVPARTVRRTVQRLVG